MAVWLPEKNVFYIPPQPFTKIPSTDDFVVRTSHFFHAGSGRLLTVGHPFYETKRGDTVTIPKVSPNQYRVFRVKLPNPNKFAFGDKNIFDPDKERLVWAVRGLEISRGQPLGISVTGNPLFNRGIDVENSGRYTSTYKDGKDHRQNNALDPKQVQLFMIGCKPPLGEYWTRARRCTGVGYANGDPPPIELRSVTIQDGDMSDIGFGAMDFKSLQENKANAPLDIAGGICIYPDYIRMAKEQYGDSMFFFARREQLYARHFFSRDGALGSEPTPAGAYIPGVAGQEQATIDTDRYVVMPSGSLVSSDAQLFNRPYWLQRAQGKNNGIAWNNELFLTVVDNTRGTIMNLSIRAQNGDSLENYQNDKFNEYLRHCEEYELEFILQLCKVSMTAENIAYLHTMDETIINGWELNVNPPSGLVIEDSYRYIESLATKCPDAVEPAQPVDPYGHYQFWNVDLTQSLSEELDEFPLGRKFLFQSGMTSRSLTNGTAVTTTSTRRAAKRRRRG
ncbi:L1 protein [Tree shrew papillomavirus 1]|uniref:Major capsid protein L1 n=1 Tax=Tree shrew papillomavirus 1 TaxID=2562515 RepID=A0AAF1D2G4_9PAPI|nr:L1 protein [Tree shrew papillomavirus 1]